MRLWRCLGLTLSAPMPNTPSVCVMSVHIYLEGGIEISAESQQLLVLHSGLLDTLRGIDRLTLHTVGK